MTLTASDALAEEDPPPPVLEPATWYAATARDDNPDCINAGKIFDCEIYSNAGVARVVCGICGQDMRILTAIRMDPQPEVV